MIDNKFLTVATNSVSAANAVLNRKGLKLLMVGGVVEVDCLGAPNIVPTLFRRAGNQREMPASLALAAATGAGYAGMLAGPALMGFIAHSVGLREAFIFLALLMCLVPALNKSVNGS